MCLEVLAGSEQAVVRCEKFYVPITISLREIGNTTVFRHNLFQLFQNQHQIVVISLQRSKNGIPVCAVAIVLRGISLVIISKAGSFLGLNGQRLLGRLQSADVGLPDNPGTEQHHNHRNQRQTACQNQQILPQRCLQVFTGFTGLIQRRHTKIQCSQHRTNSQHKARIVVSRISRQHHTQRILHLAHQGAVIAQCAAGNCGNCAAAAHVHCAEVIHHHGQFAQLIGRVRAAADKPLEHHGALLHEGHTKQILLHSQEQIGIGILGRLLLRFRFSLLLAAADFHIQAQFLGCLGLSAERCTNCRSNTVAAVIHCHHGQATGIGHTVVAGQHGSGHSPQLHSQFLQAVFLHHRADALPDQLIIMHIHREIHIHVGSQQFF